MYEIVLPANGDQLRLLVQRVYYAEGWGNLPYQRR